MLIHSTDILVEPQDWGKLLWYCNGEICEHAELTLGKCVIDIGSRNSCHIHPNCQEILLVLKGTIRHTLGRETVEMSEGDVLIIPPGIRHQAVNLSDKPAELLIVYPTPFRQTEPVSD